MATEKPKLETMSARIVGAIKSVIEIIRDMKPERIARTLVDPTQVEERVQQLHHWTPSALTCEFRFESFADTVGFFNTVAAVAAAFDHYPKMVVEEMSVEITVTTPGVGLTEADFALIARIEELASETEAH